VGWLGGGSGEFGEGDKIAGSHAASYREPLRGKKKGDSERGGTLEGMNRVHEKGGGEDQIYLPSLMGKGGVYGNGA